MAGLLTQIEEEASDLAAALDFDLPEELSFGVPEELGVQLPEAPDLNLDDALEADLVYMAIGASDVFGVGASPLDGGYAFRIEDALDDSGTDVQLVTAAIPGGDVEAITDAVQLAERIAPEPDLVTVWVGANDLVAGAEPAAFEEALDNLLDEFDGSGAIVAIADLPDLTQLPRFLEDPAATVTAERVAAFNEAIHDQAEAHDAVLVALSAQEVDEQFVSDADGFHPNDAGHAAIADLFLEAIAPELGSEPVAILSTSDLDPLV
jgi:lysophospholipase L1-like esterase